MMVKIEFCDYNVILTFDDLECWLELNEEEPFTTVVIGTISASKERENKKKKKYAQGRYAEIQSH